MKRIAVFENEYKLFEPIFDVVNYLNFDNGLVYNYYMSSQALIPFDDIKNFDAILIDIELTPKSELDGYALIKHIHNIIKSPKILIITGHSKVKENLKERGLPENIPIIQKPIQMDDLAKSLKSLL